MFVTALEQYTPPERRIVTDPLAPRILPTGLRLAALLGRSGWLRRQLENGSERTARGLWGGLLCRKRYVRDQVGRALAEGIEQVVVLGAGLDTLAAGVVVPTGVPVFEVDMPENIATKRERLRAVLGEIPAKLHLVEVRFGEQDLATTLAEHGFRAGTPTVFVWEAVSQYLTEDAVRQVLSFLGTAAIGSRLLFTFVRRDYLDGTEMYGAAALHKRYVEGGVWHFAIEPSEVDGLLREYGWAEQEQVGPAEYADRYLRPAGRDLPATEIERFVSAERR